MKKLLSIIAVMVLALVLSACGTKTKEWRIVMITDVGTITDKSFNQGTYEGVEKFAKEFKIPYSYFRPNAGTQKDYEEAIDLNVANGANVIVCPGFLFETAIHSSQIKYPDVKFILIDGQPHSGDYKIDTKENTSNILFQEEQAGFLAGYAAVADGYKNLGFMGGMAVPAVKKFGIGYVAGAYYAANELNKTITFSADRYEYLDDFENKPEHTTTANGWYSAGVEVIFAAAGGAGNAVMAAAETSNKHVIGVDVDQSGESETVISSAMKELAVAVYQELDALINKNAFNGGKTAVKGAKEGAIGLPGGESFKFKTFTKDQYDTLFAKLVDETIKVPTDKAKLTTFLKDKCGNPSVADLIAKTEE